MHGVLATEQRREHAVIVVFALACVATCDSLASEVRSHLRILSVYVVDIDLIVSPERPVNVILHLAKAIFYVAQIGVL